MLGCYAVFKKNLLSKTIALSQDELDKPGPMIREDAYAKKNPKKRKR